MTTDQKLMTVKEVARFLRLSLAETYRLVNSKCLTHFRVGPGRGAIRIAEADVMAFLENRRQGREPAAARRRVSRPPFKTPETHSGQEIAAEPDVLTQPEQAAWLVPAPQGCGAFSFWGMFDRHAQIDDRNTRRIDRLGGLIREQLRSRFLRLLQQMFRIVTEVLIDPRQLTRIFMSHQDRHRERIDTVLQRVGGPGMPQGVQGIFRSDFVSPSMREFAFGFLRSSASFLGTTFFPTRCVFDSEGINSAMLSAEIVMPCRCISAFPIRC